MKELLRQISEKFGEATQKPVDGLQVKETGTVVSVGKNTARADGLSEAGFFEVLNFPNNKRGLAFNLYPEAIDVVLLDRSEGVRAGQTVERTQRVLDVPVGDEVVSRVVDPLGRELDEKGPVKSEKRLPLERKAPSIMDRAPVSTPLMTGLLAVDSLIPIGRGQRELIAGDRATGKTAVAIDTIINQKESGVICFYCAIGKESSDISKVVSQLRDNGAMEYTTVVATHGEDSPGKIFAAPYAAASMAEYFMEKGKDVLIVFDDITRHARAYRELSLLLRRPPAREAFPGDIFYIHSRLLERATHLKKELGGGSMTALPIVETEAQNISAYIPTNLISITDGQIYLSPGLFQKGILPAVDIGRSVSRVGAQAQLPVFKNVSGDLKLSYSQFEELETFARFGTRLEESTRQVLRRGRRVREALKQPQFQPLSPGIQAAILTAVNKGVLDDIKLEKIQDFKNKVKDRIDEIRSIADSISQGSKLNDEEHDRLASWLRELSEEIKNADDTGS